MNRKQFLRRSALLSLAASGLPGIAHAFQAKAAERTQYKSELLKQGDKGYLRYGLYFSDEQVILAKSDAPVRFALNIDHFNETSGKASGTGYYDLERTGDPKQDGDFTEVKLMLTSTRGTDMMNGKFPHKVSIKIKPMDMVILNLGKGKTVELKYFTAADNSDSECFLTTACTAARGLPDDCTELTVLRGIRDQFMKPTALGASMIEEYYRIAPGIVSSVNQLSNRHDIWNLVYKDLVVPSVRLIRQGRGEEAVRHYAEYVSWMKEAFPAKA